MPRAKKFTQSPFVPRTPTTLPKFYCIVLARSAREVDSVLLRVARTRAHELGFGGATAMTDAQAFAALAAFIGGEYPIVSHAKHKHHQNTTFSSTSTLPTPLSTSLSEQFANELHQQHQQQQQQQKQQHSYLNNTHIHECFSPDFILLVLENATAASIAQLCARIPALVHRVFQMHTPSCHYRIHVSHIFS